MMRAALLVLLICTAALSVEERPKRIWEWTVEERLAQRFDRERIEAREAQYQEDFREQLAKVPPERRHDVRRGAGVHHDRVDGRRNPELFLPHELFESLLRGFDANAERRLRIRSQLGTYIRQAGFDDVLLWDQLSVWGADYIAVTYERRPPADADETCRARYAALEAARRHYGRERFDWFLYAVIAPDKSATGVSVGADPAARLRRLEAGCR